MDDSVNRRELLKLLSLSAIPYQFNIKTQSKNIGPNIIVMVFDTFSAKNISTLGYQRNTTPNIERLSSKAIVYHNHYAGGHSTYPGTSTLLTGTHLWTNRGYGSGTQLPAIWGEQNLFNLFNDYERLAYTHNPIAEIVLNRMASSISKKTTRQELFLKRNYLLSKIIKTDFDNASVSYNRIIKQFDDGYSNSLLLSSVSRYIEEYNKQYYQEIQSSFPYGLPVIEGDNYFLLETAIDWIINQISTQSDPFLGYFHLLPPHSPYNTRKYFYNNFKNDGFEPISKPIHLMTDGIPEGEAIISRQQYDEFILYVDAELGRLMDTLESQNLLDNTYFVLTSDHGEIFERGLTKHRKPTFLQPLINVPLIIFPPGQKERIDIHYPTSAIDVIPTLLSICGKEIPEWLEGNVIPPFSNQFSQSAVFSMDARRCKQKGPFTTATVMMRQNDYKLTYYFGNENIYEVFDGKPYYELYNISNDPEELENLWDVEPFIGKPMLEMMKSTMQAKGAL